MLNCLCRASISCITSVVVLLCIVYCFIFWNPRPLFCKSPERDQGGRSLTLKRPEPDPSVPSGEDNQWTFEFEKVSLSHWFSWVQEWTYILIYIDPNHVLMAHWCSLRFYKTFPYNKSPSWTSCHVLTHWTESTNLYSITKHRGFSLNIR